MDPQEMVNGPRDCPVCGHLRQVQIEYAMVGYDIARCRGCDCAYVVNDKVSQDLLRAAEPDHERTILSRHLLYRKKAERDLRALESLMPTGRLLDVGCGVGMFLQVAAESGWSAQGVDLNARAVEHARQRGCEVFEGTLKEFTSSNGYDGYFDAITMFGVIEHMFDPAGEMRDVHRLLKPEGVVAVQTPSDRNLFKVLARAMYRATRGDMKFALAEQISPVGHRFSLGQKCMNHLLRECGFEVLSIRGYAHPLAMILHRYSRSPVPRRIVMSCGVSVVYCLGDLIGMKNHIMVYARKP